MRMLPSLKVSRFFGKRFGEKKEERVCIYMSAQENETLEYSDKIIYHEWIQWCVDQID